MDISRTKQKQRDNIIKHARALFLKKGIANTSIKEIAECASIYRKTVYNHFADKEEIATIILLDYLKDLRLDENYEEKDMTAFDLLSRMLKAMVTYSLDHKDTFRFLAHYDYYFNDHSELMDGQIKIDESPIHKIIKLGEKDGSIYMHNTTADKLAFIILRSFLTFLEDVLYRESIYKEEYDFEESDVYTHFEMLLRGLQS